MSLNYGIEIKDASGKTLIVAKADTLKRATQYCEKNVPANGQWLIVDIAADKPIAYGGFEKDGHYYAMEILAPGMIRALPESEC